MHGLVQHSIFYYTEFHHLLLALFAQFNY